MLPIKYELGTCQETYHFFKIARPMFIMMSLDRQYTVPIPIVNSYKGPIVNTLSCDVVPPLWWVRGLSMTGPFTRQECIEYL